MNKGIILFLTTMLILTACSNPKEKLDETNISEIKVVDDFEIQFLTAQKLSSKEGEVLQLNFRVKNKSTDTRLFDSFVFVAENKEGKNLGIAPEENFGSELKPGESKEGSIYYYVEGSAPITVTYDDLESDKTETWKIEEIVE